MLKLSTNEGLWQIEGHLPYSKNDVYQQYESCLCQNVGYVDHFENNNRPVPHNCYQGGCKMSIGMDKIFLNLIDYGLLLPLYCHKAIDCLTLI